MMTTAEVAQTLVSLCRQGKFEEAVQTLYSPDVVSIEPEHTPDNVVKGLEAIAQKGAYFATAFQIHGVDVSDAIVSNQHFSVMMALDVTQNDNGQRYVMDEICVYHVKEGKVVLEQFFF
jgi:ketosteroid isomerase-like protein